MKRSGAPELSWRAPLLRLLVGWRSLAGCLAEDVDATCAAGSGPCGASAGAHYWPTQKGTLGRTGFSPHRVPDISKKPAWSWSDPYDDTIRATPLIDDRMNIFLSTVAGRIYKFDVDGNVLWRRELPFKTLVVGCLHDGKFIIATGTGLLVALDMETGVDLWRSAISSVNVTAADTGSLAVYDGLVVSATHNSTDILHGNSDVVAVRAKDGGIVWRYVPEVHVYNFQALIPEDGTFVFQDRAGGLYRLNLTDGREIWKSGKRGPPWSETFTTGATVSHAGKLFAVSNRGASPNIPSAGILHVYKLEDGSPVWEQDLLYAANQAVAIGPHPVEKGRSIAVVGFGANPGFPLALSWYAEYGLAMAALGKYIDRWFSWLIKKSASAMAAYDVETGARLWHYELPPFRKYATAGDSERLDRRAADIQTNNTHNDIICLPDSCSQPVVGPDGTAYMGWQDGKIYAVKDANGDGKIDESEVVVHQLSDGFQGSFGLAPGLFAAAPCGGGLYVWKS